MIKRIDTHRTDTKANRIVLTQLNEDWLIRNLEERDYGIDLQLEYFKQDSATGYFTFIQLKGTEKSFVGCKKISLSFPVKTIEYALLFNIPFFVFHTSIEDRATKFIWLQKYVEIKLKNNNKWKSQGEVTIHFPIENDLEENSSKIIDIIKKDRIRKSAINFISYYENLSFHSQSVISGQTGVAQYCSHLVENILSIREVVDHYNSSNQRSTYRLLKDLSDCYIDIYNTNSISHLNRKEISEKIDWLNKVKFNIINETDFQELSYSTIGEIPY